MNKERYYDEEIAPILFQLAEKCQDAGLSFVGVVEYAPNKIGRTATIANDAGLELIMINHCAKTVPNIDGYVIALARYAKENGIDMTSSIVMSMLGTVEK